MKNFIKGLRSKRSSKGNEREEEGRPKTSSSPRLKTSSSQRSITPSATVLFPLSIYRDGPLTASEQAAVDGAAELMPTLEPKAEKIQERVDCLREALQTNNIDAHIRKDIEKELSRMIIKDSSWEAVVAAHKDKFLEDVLASKPEDFENSFGCFTSTANFDRRMDMTARWHNSTMIQAQKLLANFQQIEDSKVLETFRADQMERNGALHHIKMMEYAPDNILGHPCAILAPFPDMWRSIKPGHQKFVPGNWWLNLSCASRDGIIDDSNKEITRSTEGLVCAIVLNIGEVTDQSNFEEIAYIKEGSAHESIMSASLLQHGVPLRVIRGYNLRNCGFAPKGGFRYDGLYNFVGYSIQTVDAANNIRRATLILKRCPNQIPVEFISNIPRPSQLDEWRIYNKIRFHGMGSLDNEPQMPIASPVKARRTGRLFE